MFPWIDLGIVHIPVYSTLFIAAFFLAVLMARKTGNKFGIAKEDVLYASIYGAIGLLIGSKLLYFLTKLPALFRAGDAVTRAMEKDMWQTVLFVLNFSFGGLVFYGGLLGTLLGIWCYCQKFRIPFVPYLDLFAPLIPLVHGVGRIGCFCSGCCYGIEYHGIGQVQFPPNELVPELDAVPRFPVQLLEAGMNFVLCVVLLLFVRKGKMTNGRMMGIYLIYYSIARFGLELLRGDKIRGSVSIFSTSQLISVLLLPAGILLVTGKWVEKHCKDSQSVV